MSARYDQEAIELCRKLYCKYGGANHAAVEAEMRKVYGGWRKNLLHDRGKGDQARLGWITKFGFENSLRIHVQKLVESVNDDEQDLYLGIKTIRKQLQVEAIGRGADAAVRREFREYAKIEIEARRNLDLTRDNLDTFVSGYEKQMVWAAGIDTELAKLLIKHGPRFAELAEAHYGKTQTEFDGASNREDESGGEPFSLLD